MYVNDKWILRISLPVHSRVEQFTKTSRLELLNGALLMDQFLSHKVLARILL